MTRLVFQKNETGSLLRGMGRVAVLLLAWVGLSVSTVTAQELFLHHKLQKIPVEPDGPFIRLGDGGILTVEKNGTHALVSRDGGASWERRVIFENPEDFSISARAI